jgi:acyl-coenzyme A thioesterase PaaI-like protein
VTEDWLPPHHGNCLGCGPDNPASLRMRFRLDGERVVGEVTPTRLHEGAPGYVHGGAISTILDDALGTLLYVTKTPAVTAKLEVDFRSPAFIDRTYDVEAWIGDRDGRKLHLHGQMREGERLVAEGYALFIVVDAEHFRRGYEASGEARGTQLPW